MRQARNLSELLRETAREHPQALAFRYGDESIRYQDWADYAARLAAFYWSLGLRPGDVIALLLPSTPFYLMAYLGAAQLGLVTAGMNLRYRRREISAILARSGARLLLGVRTGHEGVDFQRLIDEEAPGLPTLEHTIWIDPGDLADTGALVRRLSNGLGTAPDVDVDPDAPATIIFTSGTTGVPKGACYCHRNLLALAAIESRRYEAGLEPVRKHLAAGVSFAHLGTMARIAVQITNVAMSIVHDRFDPTAVLETIARERLPHLGAFPTQMLSLLDHPGRARYDLSCLRSILLGGAPVAPELIQRVQHELGAVVSVRYSSTEVGIATASLPSDPVEVLCATVGKPTAGVELRIVDPQNRPLPAGEIGEVVVRSPATMVGYWNDPDATARTIDSEGWVHTGDLGFLDKAGYLHLRGRANEMYIRGGFNVYPMEVENVLLQHPKVARVAMIGVPDRRLGEVGWAFVVPVDPNDPPTLEELRSFVGRELASFKRPDGLTIIRDMPLTPMFKPDKRALRQAWDEANARR
ncbi:MAG: AMP-binding protein [Candidatus Binatia bacterium]|nr:AMP-binding protein [Candidatus Binatia bacterium]